MNLRDQALIRFDRSLAELRAYAPGDLTDDEVLQPIREEAANLERLLKQLALGLGNRATLNNLIDRLRAQGLPSADAVALHALREAANKSKHDPLYHLEIDEVVAILAAARGAVSNIGVIGTAAGSNAEVAAPQPRRFAISVFDYPTHGEVDYQVGVLLADGHVVHLDSYQARFSSESEIKVALSTHGTLDEEPSDKSVVAYKRLMKGSTELTAVWIFQGSLRDLAKAFGPYQHSEALSFLQRHSDRQASKLAACLAAIDLGMEQLLARPESLTDVMVDDYAVASTDIGVLASEIIALVVCASDHGVAKLRGPRALSSRAFQALSLGLSCLSRAEGVGIELDGSFLLSGGTTFEPVP